jgi:type VI secretion system protein ImpC
MADAKEQAGGAQAESAGSSLVEEILLETKLRPSDEGFSLAREGMRELIAMLATPERKGERVQQKIVDEMISEIDQKMSKQLDQILHNPAYQQMESSWRGLKLVVDRTDFRENIKIELVNVSKDDLLTDFQDSPEIPKSGLFKLIYSREYGQFGGSPVGGIIGNYYFGPGSQDIALLQYVAAVGAMAHAPFISAAGPQFFGEESWLKFPNLKDLKSILEGPRYTKWRGFRESEDARYVGLTTPRFLLRLPYNKSDNPIKSFDYNEAVTDNHESYLWGNTAYTFATRLTDSFAKWRWCPNIIGPQGGGAVENLPIHTFQAMGEVQAKIPTEILVTERREFELADEGFIALTMRKDSDNACFFSANSCQKAKYFGTSAEGRAAETNYKLGTQLPYMFIVSRLAHYLKVLQRENLGSWKERSDLQRELNEWIRQYVVDMDNPLPGVRSRRPLRQAQVTVEDVEGNPGWYKVDLKVRPHFKYMGADITLSLVGRLEQK